MATLDELQAQLEELNRRVNEITAPPDDYYTHRFSGEEIDNAVDRVKATPGSGAITAKDTLAAEQVLIDIDGFTSTTGWYRLLKLNFSKIGNATFLLNITHAYYSTGPGNITALLTVDHFAPKITILQSVAHSGQTTISDLRLVEVTTSDEQFYFALDMYYAYNSQNNIRIVVSPVNPYARGSLDKIVGVGTLEKIDALPDADKAIAFAEWITPPMVLGVEYRTAEKHNGKPVYTKLVDCGAMPNNTAKTISYSDDVNVRPISVTGTWSNGTITMPGESGTSSFPVQLQSISLSSNKIIIVTHTDRSSMSASATAKYWKATD